MFVNVFSNGFYGATRRALNSGAAGFVPTLQVTTRDAGEAVEIRVRDNGTGIPAEIRDKLFQPFFTTKPTGEGTGLGLSITYDIVTKQHGGTITVGRVDGFNQHESACKTDERSVAGVGLLAAHGDAFVSLELADRLFDARPEFIQPLGEETTSLLGVLTTRNHRCDATRKRGEAIRLAVITLISHCDARADVRANVERCLELGAVAGFATSQMEVERKPVEIGLEVDLGRETATRAAEGLMLLPPFAPAAET